MKKRTGLSLVELIIVVALIPVVGLGITSGIVVLRNLQFRTDSVIRLTNSAVSEMEKWKQKPFNQLNYGEFNIKKTDLKPNDKITVLIKETEDKNLKEIIIKADNNDPRQPQHISLSTMVSKYNGE